MSTEIFNKTSVITDENPQGSFEKKDVYLKKVNIEVLKKRVFEEERKEKFQNRVLIGMFCLSLAILGYIVV
tara:strand:- start:216 stop:428 length:213 start_codon:yes stop_codon:yes gene_type:complete